MTFLKDALSIFKNNELTFIKKYEESAGVYTFVFEKEKALTWYAGQHGLFTITHKKIKGSTKPFTVASAPSEDVVKITTKISEQPSDFKKALLELEPGIKMRMKGPVGSFYVKDDDPLLFIACGIGITPFRAILKQLEMEGSKEKPVKLLYLDSQQPYLYKDELDAISQTTPSIDVMYLSAREELYQEMDAFSSSYKNDVKYFIAGSKSMVDSITSHLQSKDISKRNIKKDTFFGYK